MKERKNDQSKGPTILADLLIDLFDEASKPCTPLSKFEEPIRKAIVNMSKKQPFTHEQQQKLNDIYNKTGWDGGFDF
jgi:hypothetical protein